MRRDSPRRSRHRAPVATIVPRAEIAAVLEDREEEPELSLRIISEGHESEPSVIAMSWSRDELARVLEEATRVGIVLTFDREELSRAIDDVEAHGLRERALVFAVAATGVLGTGATIANAMPVDVGGGSVITSTAPAGSVTDVSSTGGYTTAAAATGGADAMVSDAASGAGYAAPASGPGASAAALGVTDVSSGGGYTAPINTAAAGAADTRGSARRRIGDRLCGPGDHRRRLGSRPGRHRRVVGRRLRHRRGDELVSRGHRHPPVGRDRRAHRRRDPARDCRRDVRLASHGHDPNGLTHSNQGTTHRAARAALMHVGSVESTMANRGFPDARHRRLVTMRCRRQRRSREGSASAAWSAGSLHRTR